jgi:serine/threonine-protein kinase
MIRCGPWRVLATLSRGGMGETKLVERADGVRGVLKLRRASLAGPPVERRFSAERRILDQLDLPGVPRLLDAGECNGEPFLVMEWIDARPVLRELERVRAATSTRLAAALACVGVVARLHSTGVVHGDLTPDNLLLAADGCAYAVDLGLARFENEPETSAPEHALMTPRYAAPERFEGAPPTRTSDVFALGLIVHEIVTGLPARPAGASLARLHASPALLPPTALALEFDAALRRAVAARPEQRPRDAGHLALELRSALE